MLSVEIIKDGVHTVVPEYPIRKVDLFGSYAEGTNTAKSDVDLLVEFSTTSISLFILNALKYRLEEILKTDVDIIHAPINKDALITVGKVVPLYES